MNTNLEDEPLGTDQITLQEDKKSISDYGSFGGASLFGRAFIFNKKNGKFNILSIIPNGGGYETILKKDDDIVYINEIGYDDVRWFKTQKELEDEILRLGVILEDK